MSSAEIQKPALIVGVGASAGGLAAFKSFLSNLPADTGMAYVLVQHLSPNHKSLLVELLGAQSPIPVVAATDGLEVKANCVFVIPPDATLTIVDGNLRLQTPAPVREHRRPIDTFLTSLAQDCGERAVGIVLAGVGSDGTIGIRSIKENGGLTLAQAEFDHHALSGMPHSAAASGMVDHVMPVEGMPGKLIAYHKHLNEVADKKDGHGNRHDIKEHLGKITSVLHARSQHDFSGYKDATLIRRLQRRMQVLHIDSGSDYVERLRTDQGEVEALFREILIGVTQFFRDPEAFDSLNALAILPMLDAKDADEPVRVWVPGCSTGEEVYSIAILLREALRTRNRNPDVKIFGTDIDANAVAIARCGRYRKAASGVSPERFERWFAKAGDDYCPVPEIRDMCVFSTHSLIKDPPFSKLDLISCRNVMIYLDEQLQDRLMRTFHYALHPGGYLFLGSAESVTRNARLFAALDKKHRILQRRDAGANLPAFQPKAVPALESQPSPPARRRFDNDKIDKAIGRLVQHYAPAYFVIDRNHEIIRFSGAETGHYLEPSQGAASLDLFSVVHKSLRSSVRTAVSQALANGQRVVNDNLTIRIDGKVRALELIVDPIGGENESKTGGSCIVAFRDTSPVATGTATVVGPDGGNPNVQVLERELAGTKAQLQAAIDEQETQLEDMKSTTEEFQAVNEELQSSNEELETSKEEMQSINEELQTINSELGNKNELLTRLNADMQNLLDSTEIATVFLDRELRIRHFTPALTQLFPVRESDRGRPVTQIVTELDYTTIRADVEKVQRDGAIVEHDLTLKDGTRSFVMRIRPYRAAQDAIEGVVITFVDITERKQAEAVMSEAQKRLETMFDASPIGMYLVDSDFIIRLVNQIARPIFGDIGELIGRDLGEVIHILWEQAYADEIVERFRHTLKTGEPYVTLERVEQRRDSGVTESYEWQIHRTLLPAGGYGVVCYFRDISDRKRAENVLAHLAAIVTASDDAIISKDLTGNVQSWNKAAQSLFGYAAEEMIGKSIMRLIPHDRADEELNILERLRRGEVVEQYDTERLHKDGSTVSIALTISPVRNAAGHVIGASKIAHDISERKRVEAQLVLISRELQHRTKNLLGVVQSIAARSLVAGRSLDDARMVLVDRLHALGHATDLLSATNWQGASIKDVVERALGPFAKRFSIEGGHVMLNSNSTQGFALVIHELCTNSQKYGALSIPDGTVAIRWSVLDEGTAARLLFRWQEHGGPPVTPPEYTGFGTTLLQRAVGGAESPPHVEYAPDGLIYTLTAPLAAVAVELGNG